MHAIVAGVMLCVLAAGPETAQRTERQYQVPAGTALLLKLRTPVDSGTATVLDQVEATLWSPVVQDGTVLIPEGSVAFGAIVDVKRASEKVPVGSVAIAFSIVEHGETKSRATMTTRPIVVEAPRPQPTQGGRRERVKPTNVTLPEGAPFVAITAEPLVVRIPK